jgi:hypothetical protein
MSGPKDRVAMIRPIHGMILAAAAGDRGPEPLADPAQRRRGRDREPAPAQPPGDLRGRLQGRNPAIEIDPVEPRPGPALVG